MTQHQTTGSDNPAGGQPENDPKLRAEPVWDGGDHPGSWRAMWAYSAKWAARDNKTITLQEEPGQGGDNPGEGGASATVREKPATATAAWTRRPWPWPGGWWACRGT